MTDRGRAALITSQDQIRVGPSAMRWTGSTLEIAIDEVSSLPIVSRVRGTITLTPKAVTHVELALTADGAHVWRPFAPLADIRVTLDAPGWQWSGEGYFDANFGLRPLEDDFRYWTWGCFPAQTGATAFYDLEDRARQRRQYAVQFRPDGNAALVDAPPATAFRRSLWQVRRTTRADPGTVPKQTLNMLDAPFYSRATVETVLDGETVQGVHEALDLTRFRSPLIKLMLALRVPRRAAWTHQER